MFPTIITSPRLHEPGGAPNKLKKLSVNMECLTLKITKSVLVFSNRVTSLMERRSAGITQFKQSDGFLVRLGFLLRSMVILKDSCSS